VAAALTRLHTRAGRRVTAFKCGPDFLDPHWLSLASGRPAHNLDLWMTGDADVRARLRAAAAVSDLIVVEGVMGLYDGEPSAADLAQHLGLPVLCVIDAGAMAGTFGALAFGLQHYRSDMPWAGVLANRVASERHAEMLRASLAGAPHAPANEHDQWLGAVMRNTAFSLPERHLGLTVASELPDALQRLDAAADALATTPLGQMDAAALARWAVGFDGVDEVEGFAPLLHGKTVAVARDTAFCFIYPANLDTLASLGAHLVYFSPLANEPLPPCDAVWLPGGYPELHAAALAKASATRDSLKAHVADHRPVWAECGGMMVLFDHLIDGDGTNHTMWGLLPGAVQLQQRLAGLGPQQLGLPGGDLRGHTFHYSRCDTPLEPESHTTSPQAGRAGVGEVVYRMGSVRASYFHAWFASRPQAAASLFLNEATEP
jgi:cobyrinic acid a,c-diamide synthase